MFNEGMVLFWGSVVVMVSLLYLPLALEVVGYLGGALPTCKVFFPVVGRKEEDVF